MRYTGGTVGVMRCTQCTAQVALLLSGEAAGRLLLNGKHKAEGLDTGASGDRARRHVCRRAVRSRTPNREPRRSPWSVRASAVSNTLLSLEF
eukprot:1890443-Prymnesium_polylepis.1